MNHLFNPFRKHALRSASLAVVSGVLCVAVATVIGQRFGGEWGHDVLLAGMLMLVIGLPGLALSVYLAGKMRGGMAFGFLAGMALRLPLGALIALYGTESRFVSTDSFGVIVAGAYLVLLVVEVLCIAPAVKKTAQLTENDVNCKPSTLKEMA